VLTAALLLLGAVLLSMGLAEQHVKRLPLSPATVYLLVGAGAGALVHRLALPALLRDAPTLAVVTELAVLVSLFTVGLRLHVPPTWTAWRVATTLASAGMLATIALATAAGMGLLGLGLAGALLLATILAPTDPVLASEVQIRHVGDRDAVRLSLTAEGGLNDGTALPVMMLALGLLGLHELGPFGARWLLVDLAWPIVGGVLVGWWFGRSLGNGLHALLRRGHALDWDELLYLGAIAASYGLARLTHSSAFLAVFAAGLGLFHVGRLGAGTRHTAPMTERLVAFGHRCERLIEVLMVLGVGFALASTALDLPTALFALLFVFVLRPLSVLLVIRRARMPVTQRRLVAWFGVRGVGSLFYLAFAAAHPIGPGLAATLASACLWTVALSIVAHGVSATPLMAWHQQRHGRRPR